MNRLFSILVVWVWGVWVGSLVGLFVAVTSLNQTFPTRGDKADESTKLLFGNSASGVFGVYERVQLALAAAALVATFGWRLCRGAPKLKTALFALIALSAASAVAETAYVSPQINGMRERRETGTHRFAVMHGLSFGLYSANLLLLAAGGVLVPFAIVGEARQRETTTTSGSTRTT